MAESKLADLNVSKSLQRFVILSSFFPYTLDLVPGFYLYIFVRPVFFLFFCWELVEMKMKGGGGAKYGWLIMGGQLS
jgi:hypothetical protein